MLVVCPGCLSYAPCSYRCIKRSSTGFMSSETICVLQSCQVVCAVLHGGGAGGAAGFGAESSPGQVGGHEAD